MNTTLKSEIKPKEAATQPFRIVLHPNETREGEWVTHMENLESNPAGGYRSKNSRDYYWGHYFDDYTEALEDYKKRCDYYRLGYNIDA